ncbi:MAG: AAA family ATPase [Williamsia sp.]|nr:AAA family ATPase [Williamsia sp.]
MIKAFVFGKFLPFHKGHEAMINFARTKCDFLTVLVCCSDKETISGATRKGWIQKTFENKRNVEVRLYDYQESSLPNTSVSSRRISEVWAAVFSGLLPGYSLLITSEEYGNYVAEYMAIQHIPFDPPKRLFPVSATAIRYDVFLNWKFLPDSVKPDFALKVVVLGTESTGKTTLVQKLSEHFNCSQVLEAAREIIADSNHFQPEELQLVARAHAEEIDKAVFGDSPLIIIDTDIYTTRSYARFVFQTDLEADAAIYNSNKANLYLYLSNDVPYLQDGTRLEEAARNLLDHSHRQMLKEHHIEFIEISGDWEQRFKIAVEQINLLIKKTGRKHDRQGPSNLQSPK